MEHWAYLTDDGRVRIDRELDGPAFINGPSRWPGDTLYMSKDEAVKNYPILKGRI